MAIPKGMAKSSLQMKKARKSKGSTSKASIGAPTDSTPSTPSPTDETVPSIPTTPTTINNSNSSSGPNWVKPKSYDQGFEPVGIPNDDNWHHDDAHVVSEHMMNYGKHPLDVVRFWMQNDGERLKNAQPYDPQHGDYSGFDYSAPDWTKTNKDYQNAIKHPGYVGDVGQSAPKSTPTKKPKPSGDQHASASAGSYSVESIRNVPGSYATGVTNGMTNRDKYVRY